MKVRTVSLKKPRAIIAALAVVTALAVGAGSATAAPGGNKGKPQPTPTVTVTTTTASPTPTPTATETTVAADVQLSCTTSGDYVVARYTSASGSSYAGAILTDGNDVSGNPNILATFGTGDYTKFLLSSLPSGVIVAVRMVATNGQTVAWCNVNTGYNDPYS